jgi:hypothetical protein
MHRKFRTFALHRQALPNECKQNNYERLLGESPLDEI